MEKEKHDDRIPKLNGVNYQEWKRDMRMILIMKDLWDGFNDEIPPVGMLAERRVWTKNQEKSLAMIHLYCEKEQKIMIAESDTGFEAWNVLAERYASMDIGNVMRVEEAFGTARRKDNQTVSDWIGQVRGLANQLQELDVEVTNERIAHRILSGVGKEFATTRAALKARKGALTVDLVSQQLMEADAERKLDEEESAKYTTKVSVTQPTTINTQYNVNPRQINPGLMHGPTAVAMAATDTQQHQCGPNCTCTNNLICNQPAGPQRTQNTGGYRLHPYGRSPCTGCGISGHAESSCWAKHPELKPKWMTEKEEWKKQRRSARNEEKVPESQTQRAMAVSTGYQTALQNPSFLRGGDAPSANNANQVASNNYVGPSNSVDRFATANYASISGKRTWANEVASSVRKSENEKNGGVAEEDEPGKWLCDTGASNHYSPFRHLFLSLTEIASPVEILTGNGYVYAHYYGTIPLIMRVEERIKRVHLEYVLYVPGLQTKVNLFSVNVLAERGYFASFGPEDVKFMLDGEVWAQGIKLGNSWWLDCDVRSHEVCLATIDDGKAARPDTLELWHQRMGHLNKRDLQRLVKMSTGIVIGTPPPVNANKFECAGCLVGKDHKQVSRVPREMPSRVLGIVFTDLCGPMRTVGYLGDPAYFCVFVDAMTKFVWTYCVVSKDDIRQAFWEWAAIQENFKGVRVHILFSDNEPCLLQKQFQIDMAVRGIQHYTTQTYSSEMNGAAENAIKHIVQRASSMMWTSRIPEGFWPEAVRVSTYLKNRSPHKAIGMTPYEAWFGVKPDLAHVKVFGCQCYGHVEKPNRTKWESHTAEGVLMGYFASEGLYAIYDVNKRIMLKKRDVTFFEGLLSHPTMEGYDLSPGFNILGEAVAVEEIDIPELVREGDDEDGVVQDVASLGPVLPDVLAMSLSHVQSEESDIVWKDAGEITEENEDHISINSMLQIVDMSFVHQAMKNWEAQRVKKRRIATDFFSKDVAMSGVKTTNPLEQMYKGIFEKLRVEYGINGIPDISEAVNEKDPTTWRQAMQSPNKAFWLKAALDEMLAISRMGTFEFVDEVPEERRALPTKWVWLIKRNDQNVIEKFKARWVARGDLQKKEIDYRETFAPVASLATLRIVLSVAASLDLEIHQMDVVSAFLNGPINTVVYLRQPEGFRLGNRFCKLNKSLYGLCQAARVWYLVLNEALTELGYVRLQADLACWIRSGTPSFCAVVGHVDDTLIIGTAEEIERTKQHLRAKFKTKDVTDGMFIGLRIRREEKAIWIDQTHYAKEVLETYGMMDCNPVNAPLLPGQVLLRQGEPLKAAEKKVYQAIVGSLGYLMNCTRPDLGYSVGKLGQYASAPTIEHMAAAKHVLRYLKGTVDAKQVIDGSALEGRKLSAYFDASWADDRDDSRSTYGYCILFGKTCLLWKSKKHRSVSLSSTDAEYLAATENTREICWILHLFAGLKLMIGLPVVMMGDNNNANGLANGTSTNSRTRHIDIRRRFVTEKAEEEIVKVIWISTTEQVADMFTKALSRQMFQRHCQAMNFELDRETVCLVCDGFFKTKNLMHAHIRKRHKENKERGEIKGV